MTSSSRRPWQLAGLLAGLAGLATSYATAAVLSIRESPIVAVGELVIRLTPGRVAERAIDALGYLDKPVLVSVILLLLVVAFAAAGSLARERWWAATTVFVVLALIGGAGVLTADEASPTSLLPLAIGFATWLVMLGWLTGALRHDQPLPSGSAGESRRSFLLRTGLVLFGTAGVLLGGRSFGRGRERVEDARKLLRLEGVTEPRVPAGARVDLEGIAPWKTPTEEFYQIHTVLAVPAVDPVTWRLRVHGMVERELELTYEDLLARQLSEAWVTLNCVSNPVGGSLIGNAWWSGVRIADILAQAGVDPRADALLQTSVDGWTCGTPLSALTDGRDALLAVGMNGQALPIEHGFPVRSIVPGLYGFVSACKWVVDLEVTRFDRFDAYWTERGWAEQAPVRLASRIDVPRSGDTLAAGVVRVGGVAWEQHVGIDAVEVAVDGGAWQPAEVAVLPTDDTWVQWAATVTLEPGEHLIRVRATDKSGLVQTGVQRDVVPDGATGWHTVDVTAQ